ncbi:hypothetical protein CEXT_24451 [Caerostris extrusa]|uniref:Uncharacterized protein n=1 Tax=Caerostris extrusa TaxID=172846 RepID=A0AAV4SI93_CAEEX|nr:hypothetical protein CEXT_24451 [Caerostris extrusa]
MNFFEDEENILSDQSEKDSSDEDSQEDTEDVVLKELLSKGCKEETNGIDVSETRNYEGFVNDSQDPMQFSLPSYQPGGDLKNFPVDSQDPMQCFSLPSYQPGGGFQNSVTENDLKRKFTDSNINDSEIHDTDNHSQEEEEGMFDSVLKEIGAEQFSSQDSDERVVIQGWNSLPYDENEGSQFGDEALQFCSGKFVSQDDAIPWTPSSSLYLKSQVSNKDGLCSPTLSMPAEDSDKLNESESKHSSPPAKKRKLFLDEKILNLENEDNLSISTKIENDTLKKSQIDTYSCKEYKSDDDSEEEEEIIRPTKKVKSSLAGKLWDSDDEDEPIEHSKFNGVSNKEHVSGDDSGEENELDDNLSESSNKDMDYFKENNSMKDDRDLYDEGIPDKQKQNGLEEDAGKKFEM